MLFNELGILGVPGFAVPEAKAQGVVIKNTVQSLASIAQNVFTKQSHSELGIVVILAENELLDD